MSNEEDREALDIAVMTVLTNVMNFPEKVQARLLGQDMRPLGGRVIDAVVDAGFHRTPAPAPDVQALIDEAREHLAVAADAAPRSARAAILAGDVEDQRMSLVARLADALEAVAHSDYHEGLEEGIKVGRAAVSTPQDTEWEYVCNNDEYRRFTDSLESARRWEDRGYTIRRRRAPSPAGPWEPVPTEGVSE